MEQISNLVVSSRVRLARNLEDIPFKTKQKGAFDGVASTIKANNAHFVSTYTNDLSPEMAQALYEQHLISRELVANKSNSIIVANDVSAKNQNKVIVMLGEEDHIRIQSLYVGFELDKAYTSAKKIADDVERKHSIAWRQDLGYLTSCPTNLGTGMRASVMMFLPALTISGEMRGIAAQLSNQHLTVRGVYGEGSDAGGYMYQISNQACFGYTEKQILEMVKSVTVQIARHEIRAQSNMYKQSPDQIIDAIMRAWGLLTNAYMISTTEAVENLAMLKIGANLGVIKFKNQSQSILDDLFFIIQPKTLATTDNRATAITTRDKIRATRIAELLRASRVQ